MKKSKRMFAVIMVFCMLVSLIPAQTSMAASGYKKAYKKLLKNIDRVENKSYFDYLRQYFGVVDFDTYFTYDLNKDGTPELFLCSGYSGGIIAVYTYNGKKAKFLSYNSYSRINTSKKMLIVDGHWHGAGGSGIYEYQIYNLKKNKLSMKYYIDHAPKNKQVSVVKDGDWSKKSESMKQYRKMYKKYVKNAKSIDSFKRYSVSDLKGLLLSCSLKIK